MGSNQIGLLKTNTPSYPAMRTLFCKEEYYDDPSAFEEFDGDGLEVVFSGARYGRCPLYSRPCGGNGVIPTTQTFGATTAVTWRSPFACHRQPASAANGLGQR